MGGNNLGGGGGDLASMLSDVSAAQTQLESAPGEGAEGGEIATLKMTIAACKADVIELLDQVEAGASLDGEDVEMLVDLLRSEIKMVTAKLQHLIVTRQARRQRRVMDRM